MSTAPKAKRDSVTLIPTVTISQDDGNETSITVETPEFGKMQPQEFHQTMCQVLQNAKEENLRCGLALYNIFLPGLEFAEQVFAQGKTINGCKGKEEYIESLGLKPATVRKWKQRAQELAARLAAGRQPLLPGETDPKPEPTNKKDAKKPKRPEMVINDWGARGHDYRTDRWYIYMNADVDIEERNPAFKGSGRGTDSKGQWSERIIAKVHVETRVYLDANKKEAITKEKYKELEKRFFAQLRSMCLMSPAVTQQLKEYKQNAKEWEAEQAAKNQTAKKAANRQPKVIGPVARTHAVRAHHPSAVTRTASELGKAAANASNNPGKGRELVPSPSPAYGIDCRPIVIGNRSEPTSHGYHWEFRKHDKLPYVVRDLNHPNLGILVECPSKVAAEQKMWEYEREAALVAA